MPRFVKGRSGNPKGRPVAARGLRAALIARYGDDGRLLVERLEALSKLTGRVNAKIALDATEVLLSYHSGRPPQSMEVSTPEGRALVTRVVHEHHDA